MKKMICILSALLLSLTVSACGQMEIFDLAAEKEMSAGSGDTASGMVDSNQIVMEPQLQHMRNICDWAVLKCYYHNVAKYSEEDAEGMLWWKKDKRFWVEYDGIVEIGVKASEIDMLIEGNQVYVSLPAIDIIDMRVDVESLDEDSIYFDEGSAEVSMEDYGPVFAEAKEEMRKAVLNDQKLLSTAEERVKLLLKNYIDNINSEMHTAYRISWNMPEETEGDTSVPE